MDLYLHSSITNDHLAIAQTIEQCRERMRGECYKAEEVRYECIIYTMKASNDMLDVPETTLTRHLQGCQLESSLVQRRLDTYFK